ncbi:signal peptidase II [Actinopolymorpha sp. B17G11]|uniref:signal peptidase II n=1 Tax=unclassified Actinopolymorpha TaxID=2627063 RepID=UPI0032D920A5
MAGDATPAPVEGEPANLTARRRLGVFSLVAGGVLGLDIVTKVLAVLHLEGREPVRVLGGLAYLQVIRNPGAAFSMASGLTVVFALFAVAVVVALGWIAPKVRSALWAVALGLALAGASGNLVDRLFRAPGPLRGHVVDFVSLLRPDAGFFPIFNVADAAISCGAALVVLLTLLGRSYDGTVVRSGWRRSDPTAIDP